MYDFKYIFCTKILKNYFIYIKIIISLSTQSIYLPTFKYSIDHLFFKTSVTTDHLHFPIAIICSTWSQRQARKLQMIQSL